MLTHLLRTRAGVDRWLLTGTGPRSATLPRSRCDSDHSMHQTIPCASIGIGCLARWVNDRERRQADAAFGRQATAGIRTGRCITTPRPGPPGRASRRGPARSSTSGSTGTPSISLRSERAASSPTCSAGRRAPASAGRQLRAKSSVDHLANVAAALGDERRLRSAAPSWPSDRGQPRHVRAVGPPGALRRTRARRRRDP